MLLPRCFVLAIATGAASLAAPPSAGWRPFSDDSPWNQPIPANVAVDPDSPGLIRDLASRGPLHINIKEWSISVYYVDAATTPKHEVADSRPGIYGAGFEFPRSIPIPDGAMPSPPYREGSDNHLCIVDRARAVSWDMWLARRDDSGHWSTGLGARVDLSGTGVAPPWFAAKRELDSHRARASGFPLIAGLIRLEEIRAGRIEHALAFAYDHCRAEFFVPPASTAQATQGPAINSRGIPMGGRIQLDPGWDVETSGLSPAVKVIARALQKYGAYCSDYADGNVIYGENSPEAIRAWHGLLSERELEAVFTSRMMRTHFRVIAMGNLLPGQNLTPPPPYVLSFVVAGGTQPARIDQLTRSITVPAAGTAASGPRTANWTVYPAATSASVDGRPVASGTLRLDLVRPLELKLTAPDGASSIWHVAGER